MNLVGLTNHPWKHACFPTLRARSLMHSDVLSEVPGTQKEAPVGRQQGSDLMAFSVEIFTKAIVSSRAPVRNNTQRPGVPFPQSLPTVTICRTPEPRPNQGVHVDTIRRSR